MKLTETRDGTIIEVFVKPNQPRFKIIVDGGEIKVLSSEEPAKGKVNKEIIKEFSKLFHAPVKLIFGLTSRQKKLLITGVNKKQAESLLYRESLKN